MSSKNISPTAHYTGYVWARHGLSHPLLATKQGRLFYRALQPVNAASAAVGGPTLEGLLLARHRVIDDLLTNAIESGRVSQVIEIAAGLSARGWRFVQRYGNRITYIETDLPGMAARKRTLLAKMGALPKRHRIAELNALADAGPTSLQALVATLDKSKGVAVISEGLLNYFDRASVVNMWARVAGGLQGFSDGLYLSDIHLAAENAGLITLGARHVLSALVRGRVHLHFTDAAQAQVALNTAGFSTVELHRPNDLLKDVSNSMAASAKRVRVIAATT